MKKALIISGGNIDFDFALCFLQEHSFTYLIAADKGLRFLNEAGISQSHIVGGFESVGGVLGGEYENNPDGQIWRLNAIKDDTDTHEAMNLAIELGCEEITVLGCTGTRIDHVLGAVRDLRIPLFHHVKCILLDPHNRIQLLETGISLKKEEQYGKYISLFGMGEGVHGLTLEGFAYPLKKYEMSGLDALGVSNEITAEEGTISFDSGILLMIESKD